jgi:hypothetical protein
MEAGLDCPQIVANHEVSASANGSGTQFFRECGPAQNHPRAFSSLSGWWSVSFPIFTQATPPDEYF